MIGLCEVAENIFTAILGMVSHHTLSFRTPSIKYNYKEWKWIQESQNFICEKRNIHF